MSSFIEIIDRVVALLRDRERISYRVLKREFELTEDDLEDLKEELIYAKREAIDEDGRVLVWVGAKEMPGASAPPASARETAAGQAPAQPTAHSEPEPLIGERRQLTVMFCDLVGSTALSEQLDPEELQSVVRMYQKISAQVIEHYEGYIAQYLGDGLLIYFGYPAAHEDDAARAIRSGLEIVRELAAARSQFRQPIQVRIGIHTGPVVVGQMGAGSRHEQLALGETPNIAARMQGKAEPDEVVISAATQRLSAGLFEMEERGPHDLKGISGQLSLYRVVAESQAQNRFEVVVQTGLTPIVGREHELSVLRERWMQAQAGTGQVVLLSGEPGIGKSRLVQEFKDQVTRAGTTPLEFRCSPYHQNRAWFPISAYLQRLLQFAANDTAEMKLTKLRQCLARYRFPHEHTLPLLAAVLSIPHPASIPLLSLSPEKQKELTQTALVAWLVEETQQQPGYQVWEDVHWADPSTLEVLGLLLHQVPSCRLLAVLTCRPEFIPPWGASSSLNQLALRRLDQPQVSALVERVTGGKTLPHEVVEQIVAKTDGVPLFVEELTKMVLESDLIRAVNNHYELCGPLPPLAIPATLQDSLMARLDRLAAAREVVQWGASIGREFSYTLLHAVSPLDESALQRGLRQLVGAELVFQRGFPPQAHYVFKHALIQETAYESLLKSQRQQYHQQIAQVLEARFSDMQESQPELLAQHYTEAGLIEQALPYWLQAGQSATQRSANLEAIQYLTTGLTLLATLPASPARAQTELALCVALGTPLVQTKGFANAEVETVYTRARELCQQVGDTAQIFPVLWGLHQFYLIRGDLQSGCDIAEHLLRLAEQAQDSTYLLEAHHALWGVRISVGDFCRAQQHAEWGYALYDSHQHHPLTFTYGGHDPGLCCQQGEAMALWYLGYLDQAKAKIRAALAQAQSFRHPFSLALAFVSAAWFYQPRRALSLTQHYAEEAIRLSQEHGLVYTFGLGMVMCGWARAAQGQVQEGIAQIQEGMASRQQLGVAFLRPYHLALLAEVQAKSGRVEAGLGTLAEAIAVMERHGERQFEAALYRLKGELLLQATSERLPANRKAQEAETCFQQALEVARQQLAKSFELGAAMSLARLWQSQGKTTEARDLLAPVYNWFTEGFDTADLQDVKVLLNELSGGA